MQLGVPRDDTVGVRRFRPMASLRQIGGGYHSCLTCIANGTIQMSVIRLEVDEDFAELLGSSPEQIERSALGDDRSRPLSAP